MAQHPDDEHEVELTDAVAFALREGRMILPGIQTLFGFQLIAAFNDRFHDILGQHGEVLHLVALILVALSCALAMTPVAFHQRCTRISHKLLRVTERFVGAAMIPLLLAISIDVGLVAFAVTSSLPWSVALGTAPAVIFALLWVVYPRVANWDQGS